MTKPKITKTMQKPRDSSILASIASQCINGLTISHEMKHHRLCLPDRLPCFQTAQKRPQTTS